MTNLSTKCCVSLNPFGSYAPFCRRPLPLPLADLHEHTHTHTQILDPHANCGHHRVRNFCGPADGQSCWSQLSNWLRRPASWLAANWTRMKMWWRGGHWTNCYAAQIIVSTPVWTDSGARSQTDSFSFDSVNLSCQKQKLWTSHLKSQLSGCLALFIEACSGPSEGCKRPGVGQNIDTAIYRRPDSWDTIIVSLAPSTDI